MALQFVGMLRTSLVFVATTSDFATSSKSSSEAPRELSRLSEDSDVLRTPVLQQRVADGGLYKMLTIEPASMADKLSLPAGGAGVGRSVTDLPAVERRDSLLPQHGDGGNREHHGLERLSDEMVKNREQIVEHLEKLSRQLSHGREKTEDMLNKVALTQMNLTAALANHEVHAHGPKKPLVVMVRDRITDNPLHVHFLKEMERQGTADDENIESLERDIGRLRDELVQGVMHDTVSRRKLAVAARKLHESSVQMKQQQQQAAAAAAADGGTPELVGVQHVAPSERAVDQRLVDGADSAASAADATSGGASAIDEVKREVSSAWTNWSPWSKCYGDCSAIGITQRYRVCLRSGNQEKCSGAGWSAKRCSPKHCDKEGVVAQARWSEWSSWAECSASCGQGAELRSRWCSAAGACNGVREDVRACSRPACHVVAPYQHRSPLRVHDHGVAAPFHPETHHEVAVGDQGQVELASYTMHPWMWAAIGIAGSLLLGMISCCIVLYLVKAQDLKRRSDTSRKRLIARSGGSGHSHWRSGDHSATHHWKECPCCSKKGASGGGSGDIDAECICDGRDVIQLEKTQRRADGHRRLSDLNTISIDDVVLKHRQGLTTHVSETLHRGGPHKAHHSGECSYCDEGGWHDHHTGAPFESEWRAGDRGRERKGPLSTSAPINVTPPTPRSRSRSQRPRGAARSLPSSPRARTKGSPGGATAARESGRQTTSAAQSQPSQAWSAATFDVTKAMSVATPQSHGGAQSSSGSATGPASVAGMATSQMPLGSRASGSSGDIGSGSSGSGSSDSSGSGEPGSSSADSEGRLLYASETYSTPDMNERNTNRNAGSNSGKTSDTQTATSAPPKPPPGRSVAAEVPVVDVGGGQNEVTAGARADQRSINDNAQHFGLTSAPRSLTTDSLGQTVGTDDPTETAGESRGQREAADASAAFPPVAARADRAFAELGEASRLADWDDSSAFELQLRVDGDRAAAHSERLDERGARDFDLTDDIAKNIYETRFKVVGLWKSLIEMNPEVRIPPDVFSWEAQMAGSASPSVPGGAAVLPAPVPPPGADDVEMNRELPAGGGEIFRGPHAGHGLGETRAPAESLSAAATLSATEATGPGRIVVSQAKRAALSAAELLAYLDEATANLKRETRSLILPEHASAAQGSPAHELKMTRLVETAASPGPATGQTGGQETATAGRGAARPPAAGTPQRTGAVGLDESDAGEAEEDGDSDFSSSDGDEPVLRAPRPTPFMDRFDSI